MSTTQRFNKYAKDLSYNFTESATEQCLKITDSLPVYFDPQAGGTVANGSGAWIKAKHNKGRIHEPATISSLQCIRDCYGKSINTVLDIGALYGYFSLLSKSMFPASEVIGFEMNPASFVAFQRNVLFNKHLGNTSVRCLNVGLSDNSEIDKHVQIDGFQLLENNKGDQRINVLTLDDFSNFSGFRPDLIKIDVEGYQSKIMPGGSTIIQECRPIIVMELDSLAFMKTFGTTNREVLKPLFEIGYRCLWTINHRILGAEFKELSLETFNEDHEVNSLAILLPD